MAKRVRVEVSKTLEEWWGAEEVFADDGESAVVDLIMEDITAFTDGAKWTVKETEDDDISQSDSARQSDDVTHREQNLCALVDENERLRAVCEAFATTAECAVAAFESLGKGGQQVSYHDDFANVSPSVVSRLRWWAREFHVALDAHQTSRAKIDDMLGD